MGQSRLNISDESRIEKFGQSRIVAVRCRGKLGLVAGIRRRSPAAACPAPKSEWAATLPCAWRPVVA